MSGDLLLNLFKDQFKNVFLEHAKKIIRMKIQKNQTDIMKNIDIIFDHRSITNTLRSSLATGNWGKNLNGQPIRTGVAQVLKR
jgi:DNA-directed RNA polymerase beta subunit